MTLPIGPEEQAYRKIVEALQEGIWMIDAGAVTTYVNEPMAAMLGYTPEEMIGRHLFSFMDERGKEIAAQNLERRQQGIREQHDFELRRRDGQRVVTTMETAPLEDENGAYSGAVAGVIDITARRQAEDALRASEARFRTVFEESAVGIVLADDTGKILETNRAMQDVLGYDAGELAQMRVADITHPDDRKATRALLTELLSGTATARNLEKRYVRKDGRVVHGLVTVSTLGDGGGSALLAMVQDVTELKRAEAELLRVQKLESLGVLAGGLAHDYNNLLTVLLGNLATAEAEAVAGSESAKALENAEKAALQAANLSKQLLAFSRGGEPVRAALDLRRLLVDATRFTMAGSHLACEVHVPEDLPAVYAEQGQIAQVIGNLVTNAVQAQPRTGSVTIRARGIDVSPDSREPVSTGRYVELHVEDEGPGIPEADLPRIFDPYFTTKDGGTGLGLAVAHTVVTRHGGHIRAMSEPGRGARFTILLPVCETEIEMRVRAPGRTHKFSARVLVMDDEAEIRRVTSGVLRRAGCDVLEAADGAEAVDRYRQAMDTGSRFDAVIFDLTVPGGMGGKEAVERIRELDPDARAIVSSGYSSDPIMANYRAHGFCAVLPKPWRREDLISVLETALADDATG